MGKKKQVQPEDRWTMVNGLPGVIIEPRMKMRDLPHDIRLAGVPFEGALHPFVFRAGQFFAIDWVQSDPLSWPDPKETALSPGDALVIERNGGIGFVLQSERIEE